MDVGDYADVWLRKNIQIEDSIKKSENEYGDSKIQTADEVFFRVDPNIVTKSEIEQNFEKYWIYGEQWTDNRNLTNDEIIKQLKEENSSLKQCIVELSSMI
jgi:hypothetical protein